MEHKLPNLHFSTGAFAPKISAETFEYHYGKHHKAYVDNLNRLIKGTEFENMALDDIVLKASGPVFNNAAQHWNHSFFWNCLSTKHEPELDEGFTLLINKSFGSLDGFKGAFSKAAMEVFGSGWVWLVDDAGDSISIMKTQNAGNPLTEGKKPLLVLDVWEHAYYIDYRNRRAEYVDAFWPLINWEFVMHNHSGGK